MGGKDKSHLFIELNSVSWKVFFRQSHIITGYLFLVDSHGKNN